MLDESEKMNGLFRMPISCPTVITVKTQSLKAQVSAQGIRILRMIPAATA